MHVHMWRHVSKPIRNESGTPQYVTTMEIVLQLTTSMFTQDTDNVPNPACPPNTTDLWTILLGTFDVINYVFDFLPTLKQMIATNNMRKTHGSVQRTVNHDHAVASLNVYATRKTPCQEVCTRLSDSIVL